MIKSGYAPKLESMNLNVSNFLKEVGDAGLEIYDEDQDSRFYSNGDRLVSDLKKQGYIKGTTDLKEIVKNSKKEYQIVTRDKSLLDITLMSESTMNEAKSSKAKLKEADLAKYPYGVGYTCNNPTFGYDFLCMANEIGAIKVITTQLNPKTGRPFAGKSIFYAVKTKEDYEKLKQIAKDLGSIVQVNSMYNINWDAHVAISVDDYEMGSYVVRKRK